jgi:plasmid maintenance system antidote protein VapI
MAKLLEEIHPGEILLEDIMKPMRKLPRQVDSSKLEIPGRATARGNALAAGFPARRAV